MHNLAIQQIWECSEFYRSTEQFTFVIAIVCCRCVLNSFLGKNQYSFCCVCSLVIVQYQAMYFNSDNGPFHHAHRTNGGRCVKRGSLCSVLWSWSFRLTGFLIRDSFRCSIFPSDARWCACFNQDCMIPFFRHWACLSWSFRPLDGLQSPSNTTDDCCWCLTISLYEVLCILTITLFIVIVYKSSLT